ncbi:hypothetical protein FN846DRAFT_204860 [Sphaerosporella brunnea]|uniref:DUF6924 domain-containing protein n=1 Tax=Sphaerosporella brunnea TaxID=1250544 RepID=A0A5J5F7U5_9PEZI|nr:hypothetical protein FN846DRAFT_204860 [Sphaerosporella brunnea]
MTPIICVAEIPAAVLSEILTTAYTDGVDFPPSLVLIHDAPALAKPDIGEEPTQLPTANIASYPFLSHSIASIVKYLRENAPSSVAPDHVLIADAQTITDKTLLFVDCAYDMNVSPEEAKTLRLSAEKANTIPVAIAVATMGIDEVVAIADQDGSFEEHQHPARVRLFVGFVFHYVLVKILAFPPQNVSQKL